MIPANGAPHDLEGRDVLRSLSFTQRRARDNSSQIGIGTPNRPPSQIRRRTGFKRQRPALSAYAGGAREHGRIVT
jgi:hypothetical protein